MMLKLSPDLKLQEIWANGVELASIMGKDRKNGKRVLTYPESKKVFVYAFKHPVLMTDNYRIAKLNTTLRDTLFSLYASQPRSIEYDGVSTFWNSSHVNVWCPSIDTLLFAKALRKIAKGSFKAVAEIGCGSGFLSKYVLAKNKKIKSILINDLNPYAVKCARDNIKDKRARFQAGNGLKLIRGKKFDLLICNPPYVPRPQSISDNPYEGIGLLNHLIHNGQQYLSKGGILLTNVSSLCWDMIFRKKPKMKMTVLESMKVPLKVNNILNSKPWIAHLKKCGLKKQYRKGYEYWQEINIVVLRN